METIELELSNDELLQLALEAHKQDITLNQLIHNLLVKFIEQHEAS
jgi:predicted HicB family RNase H-like nuclease